MKHCYRASYFLRQIHTFPLFLLNLSMSKRLLIVILSYGVAIPGLWFFFPRVNNGASMLLPVICLCWLFRYRGWLISICLDALALWLVYHYQLGSGWSGYALVDRAILGFGIPFLLGLTICWLRAATDLMHAARQQALTAEQKRLLALEAEHQVTIAYEQQCKINEMKDQFLRNVNHELRTPLAALGGALELLKVYSEQMDPLERTQVLKGALTNYEHLVKLISRMLDANTIMSDIPQAKSQAVCVHQLVQEVLAHLGTGDVESYTIRLQVPEHLLVWADPHLLGQVLRNLLSNVFKYVPRQTEVRIEATQAVPSSPVCLSVQDAGPGIPGEELALLFEKFVRLTRDVGGTTRGAGLGLYICKRLVEAMGGRIWVESSGRPGEGSRFCLTLPPCSPP
jgi:signal transduction histidine kinase